MSRRLLLFTLLAALTCSAALAQGPCPASSQGKDLICVLPQVYTPSGLNNPALVNTGHAAHFQEASIDNSNALNSSIGSQLSLLPLASPASGVVVAWNPSLGIYQESSASFGPILSERAETVGRHRLYFGVSYQYLKFSSLDGIDLKHIPAVFKHIDQGPTCTNGQPGPPFRDCPAPNNIPDGTPSYETEVINTSNRIDVKLHQVTGFLTFGLTNRIDVSIAVPIEDVRMGVTSTADIVPNSAGTPPVYIHAFSIPTNSTCAAPVVPSDARTRLPIPGVLGCLTQTFSSTNSASGIGDITLRGKGTIWRSERNGVALGLDLRVPTGDANNFLGSGAVGIKPFLAYSYRARVSPHVNFGYEWNGKSILAGTVTPGATSLKQNLPRQILYSVGFDAGITKNLTFAFDFLGHHFFNAPRVTQVTFNRPGFSCPTVGSTTGCPDLAQGRGTLNVKDAALGLKYRLFGKVLVTGDVLLKLDEGGLRANAVPLIGISYTR